MPMIIVITMMKMTVANSVCCSGFACVNMYLVSTQVSVNNFSSTNRGFIVGLTGTFYWLGPSAVCLIYDEWFMEDPVGCFFLFLGICMTVANILAFVFVRYYSTPNEDNESMCLLSESPIFVTDSDRPETWYERLGLNHFLLPSFQLLTWGYLAGCAVDNMFIFNIGTFTESYGFPMLGKSLPVIGLPIGGIATLAGGVLSGRTVNITSRLTYLICGTSVQAILLLSMISFGDNFHMFAITTCAIYCNNGLFWSIIPTLMGEYFGVRHLIRNLGVNLMVKSYVALAWFALFGSIYERNISRLGNCTICMGHGCFQTIFILAAASSIISVILFWCLAILERRKHREDQPGVKPDSDAG